MSGKLIELKQIIRLFIILIVIIGIILNGNTVDFLYVLFLLTFILNSQVRVNTLSNSNGIIFSIFLDLPIIIFIYYNYLGVNYLLLCITLIDCLTLLKKYYSWIIFAVFIYITYANKISYETILLNSIIFFLIYVYAIQVKKMEGKIEEIEVLYDKNRRYSIQLENTKNTLEDYTERVEAMSQLEERNRLSVEIHDTIGHRLTALLMQLEAIIRYQEVDGENLKEMLESARDYLSNCVDLLRSTVKNMKPRSYRGGILTLKDFLDSFTRQTGINTAFEIKGQPYDLLPGDITALYKNLQEATTNSSRHGKGSLIKVTLEYLESGVAMEVADDGQGASVINKGLGITGMEERVALLGGSLEIKSSNIGFTITTIIPKRREII
ncbi:sensor histidine kinase [Alkaliphilus peptidifermentans]|uniref:histidine kinase n=1 Tax=Alkaliphilus peptidifermentans DSM 18978 TaxID=1120976 RepID=A0A1G5LE97_9FIRM|nr:sensor histidine kinase [Alkaliphilus peptidifermentans]SCZ10489.1 Signal transduction histidine kinase [Alkaliphilus peptidifermentans DSM 18978]